MGQDAPPVDIGDMPELARLAEDVARTGQPRLLRRGEKDIATIVPVAGRRPTRRRGKRVTQADIVATLSTVGAWKGHIDAEAFKREIKEAREDHRSFERS
jgi:hypothetical protein